MVPVWTDQWQAVAAAFTAVVSFVSVFFVIASLRQASAALLAQNRSTDVESVIALFERLDVHWCRFRSADGAEQKNFEFGQLIGYYELSCRLFRDKVFQTKAAYTLYEHMHDVLALMYTSAEFRNRFEDLKSKDDNYENIVWLCQQPRSLNRGDLDKRRGLLARILQVTPAR